MVLLIDQMHYRGTQHSTTPSLPAPASLSPSSLPSVAPAAGGSERSGSPLAILLQADQELRRRDLAAASAPAAAASSPEAAMGPPPGAAGLTTASMPPPLSFGPLAGEPMTTILLGVTGARMGMLPEMRTPAILRFSGVSRGAGRSRMAMDGVGGAVPCAGGRPSHHSLNLLSTKQSYTHPQERPKQKRKSPTDLSGLTDEEKVERRKQQAREYSKRARERDSDVKAELAKEVEALRFVREVFEEAPHVCMVLSGDVRHTTVL